MLGKGRRRTQILLVSAIFSSVFFMANAVIAATTQKQSPSGAPPADSSVSRESPINLLVPRGPDPGNSCLVPRGKAKIGTYAGIDTGGGPGDDPNCKCVPLRTCAGDPDCPCVWYCQYL